MTELENADGNDDGALQHPFIAKKSCNIIHVAKVLSATSSLLRKDEAEKNIYLQMFLQHELCCKSFLKHNSWYKVFHNMISPQKFMQLKICYKGGERRSVT